MTMLNNVAKFTKFVKPSPFLLDNIYVKFGNDDYRKGIPMGTNCAPLVVDITKQTVCLAFLLIISQKSFRHLTVRHVIKRTFLMWIPLFSSNG